MRAQAAGADPRFDRLAGDADEAGLKVGEKTAIGAVFRVTHVVPILWALAADLAFSGHVCFSERGCSKADCTIGLLYR